MKLADIHIGDTVRIRKWEDMASEFGCNRYGTIKCRFFFRREMKILCGKEFVVTGISGDEVCLDFTDTWRRCNISADMLELASDGVIAATDCAEYKEYIDDVNNAIDCIRHFCQKQYSCVDCPIYTKDKYHTCLFRDGIAPAHWGNAEIINRKEIEPFIDNELESLLNG